PSPAPRSRPPRSRPGPLDPSPAPRSRPGPLDPGLAPPSPAVPSIPARPLRSRPPRSRPGPPGPGPAPFRSRPAAARPGQRSGRDGERGCGPGARPARTDRGGWRVSVPPELGMARGGTERGLCLQVPELEKATVRIRQPERVRGIIRSLREQGVAKLQVISDFDMTLSRFGCNGRRCPTSHNILDTSRVISEDGKKKLKDLLHYYYPIEIDPNRTLEEKRPLMVEW
ncbi:hypothetical protein Nmel_018425, partial [Mimus melanotis]